MKVKLDRPTPLVIRDGNESKILSFDLERGKTRARLLGMVHIAERRFYDHRNAQLEEDPSRIVLAEGVRPKDKAMHPSGLSRLTQVYRFVAENLGENLVAQTDVFPRNTTGVYSADLNSEELMGHVRSGVLMGPLMDFYARHAGEFPSLPTEFPELPVPEEIAKAVAASARGQLCKTLESGSFLLDSVAPFTALYKGLVVKRNERLAQLMNQAPNRAGTLMVPWGVAHFPDLVKQLAPSGWHFVSGSVEYTAYMTVPTYREQLAAAWTAAKCALRNAPEWGRTLIQEFKPRELGGKNE